MPAHRAVPADAAGPTETARARRRGQRRDRVFEAAIELFVEQGYESTTMEDIAVRADVARTSVFNYFERKSAFLDEWSARRRKRAFHALAPTTADGSLRDELCAIMQELATISATSRRETTALIGAAVVALDLLDDHPLTHEFTSVLDRRRAELRPGVEPALVGMTMATSYFAIVRAWIGPGRPPFDLRERLVDLVDLLLRGAAR
ncbi:TetR/AcrR family transcriptional regulator [Nocardioides nitrophenolicus]|uniref:TetR/AcrR family transcriptional regulator n=1 Tax=Nocardioides nitrophenolicus TaxID=60489 RepID=UPI001957831C|nr:TetR/AcrR family transcriptional regulator [Nocardioides nitrophenolicus]MBM7518582.1 AcrR family transcriptional regulator [Nocardioides nitrophenolicus]